MRALWPLVGCLLYLVASSAVSSPTQCDWNNLEEMRFHPRPIQIRTKEQMEGNLTVMMGDSEKHYSFSESLEPSRLYTLNLTCDTIHCAYILLNDDGDEISYRAVLMIVEQKLIVYGRNLEWSPADCEDTKTTTTTSITTITTTTRTKPETTTTTMPETTTTTTTPETTTTTTTTPQTTTTTTPKTTTKKTPETTTTTTTTPRTTTLGKKTPTSTSSQWNKNQGTTTTTTTTTTTKPNTSHVVTISIMVFVFLACGLGLCFIYRHRIHSGALDLYTKARTVMKGAQNQAAEQQEVKRMTESLL